MATEITLSESLEKTIELEQRALADGGTLIDRNNTVNDLSYVLLNHVKPTFAVNPGAYKAGKLYSALPNLATLDINEVARNSEKTGIDKNGDIQTFGVNEPAVNWIDGKPYVSSHREYTNLVLYSEPTSSAQVNADRRAIYEAKSWANGLTRAIRFDDQSGESNSAYSYFGNVTAGVEYTMIVMIEMADGTEPSIAVLDGGTPDIYLRLGGSGGAASGYSKKQVSGTNIWIVKYKHTPALTNGNNGFIKSVSSSSKTVYCTGLMLIEGDAPITLPYIPTNGSTVTKILDRIQTSPIPAVLNDTQGAVYQEFYLTHFSDANRYLFCLRDGGQRTQIFIRSEIASDPRTLTFVLDDGSSGLQAFKTTNAAQLGLNKMVFVYDGTNVFMTLNGITTTSTVTYNTTKNRFRLAEERGGGQNLDDNFGLTWYKDEPITQVLAQQLTTI